MVIDRDSRQPLIGANVSLEVSGELKGATTDVYGYFELRAIPVGRREITVTYLGYDPYRSGSFMLTSGRELYFEIEMQTSVLMTGEVVVRPERSDSDPLNTFTLVSSRSFTVEETERYAASVNDPGRLAVGFPGVQPQRDTRTDIFIRGNSASGINWRLMGIDIPNPNHFARIGSSGGGISIFSASLLSTSDFSGGAFPAEYGNAISGVFDMRFRRGNMNRRAYTLRAGILGLDLAAEGPLKKGRSSYLINYRYSTLGILNELGIHLVGERISNTFQDISFNVTWSDESNRHQFALWGIGGISRENESVKSNRGEWRTYTDYQSYEFDTDMGATGLSHTYLINDKSYLVSSIAAMGQQIAFAYDTTSPENLIYRVDDQIHRDNRIALSSIYHCRTASGIRLKVGFQGSWMFYDFYRQRYNFESKEQQRIIDGNGNTGLLQAFVQASWNPHPRWNLSAGLRSVLFLLNDSYSIEPRFGAAYSLSDQKIMTFAYGIHSIMVPPGSYFVSGPEAGNPYPNIGLDLIKSHHFILGYQWDFAPGWRAGLEFYFQHLRNVPIVDDVNRTYWLLNEIQSFATEPLVSKGKGYNRGIDITLERFFSSGIFMILSGSVFRSEYEPLDGNRYPTQFDSRYAGTLMGGYEWQIAENQSLQLGAKVIYTAGLPIMPLSEEAGRINDRDPPLDESNPFSIQVKDYFRTDLRIAWRRNNPNNSWLLALDLQNAGSRRNIDIVRRQFDPDLNQWVYNKMAGITPILSFQLEF